MRKFIPYKSEKLTVSIWLERRLLDKLEKVAGKADISRNELVCQCIEFALDNMDISSNNGDNEIVEDSDVKLELADNCNDDISC